MAAAWNLPVIFLIENNQYAIATKAEWVTKEQNLYKRAIGYGIEGVQVDGFNVFDVYKAVKKAADKARSGGGPTLIEARYIRILGHFVADDQTYRDQQEISDCWSGDPVERLKEYLIESETFTQNKVNEVEKSAKDAIEEAIEYARHHCTEPPLESLYDDIYADGEVII
jgi:pyruvate dehydrogenase E1 component alpha subunit